MCDKYAKPGDTIMTRNTTANKGQRLLVIEHPVDRLGKIGNEPGCAWFRAPNGTTFFFKPEHYTVVKRAGKVYHMEDEVVRLDVDTSLKKRRDDNLRHAFGF